MNYNEILKSYSPSLSHIGSVDSVESSNSVEDLAPVSVGIGTTSFAGDD